MREPLYLQYGCGWCAPEGWLNFDASPTLWFERLPVVGRLVRKNAERFPDNVQFGDIVRGLAVPPGSCAGVYCSYVLEHLALDDFHLALRNTKELLTVGGRFRLVLPDLEYYTKRYVEDVTPAAAHVFMRESGLGEERRPRGPKGWLIAGLGNSRHRWMWDFASMKSALEDAGFREIRRAQFGDSEDHRFNQVEQKDRWDNSLGVECIK